MCLENQLGRPNDCHSLRIVCKMSTGEIVYYIPLTSEKAQIEPH